jgi:hypothetical protein
MGTQTIQSQDQLEQLLKMFDWTDAFVREVHIVSPSYVNKVDSLGIMAADSSPTMRLLVTFPDEASPGLELTFEEVETVELVFRMDLNPIGNVERDGRVSLCLCLYDERKLAGLAPPVIRAKTLRYTLLDQECWGPQPRYGREYPCADESRLIDQD